MKNVLKLSFDRNIIRILDDEVRKYKKVKKVSIHKNIKVLDKGCFYNKNTIEQVYFENESKVTIIPDVCFTNCIKLEKIKLPDSLVSIGISAFKNCTNISVLELPNSVVSVSPTAFDGWRENQTIYSPIDLKQPITCKAKIIIQPKDNVKTFTKHSEKEVILKHYIITVKCGHVGRNKFMPISFPIKAYSKKEAVAIAKSFPRVKRDHKDVILDANQVSEDRYLEQIEINNNDPYLQIKRKSDQNKIIETFSDRLVHEPNYQRLK